MFHHCSWAIQEMKLFKTEVMKRSREMRKTGTENQNPAIKHFKQKKKNL